jgi:hypothetical protein
MMRITQPKKPSLILGPEDCHFFRDVGNGVGF